MCLVSTRLTTSYCMPLTRNTDKLYRFSVRIHLATSSLAERCFLCGCVLLGTLQADLVH